ncbi:hypothetical protein [Roseomonas sp. CECT 9278]|uniref:hypothetical protein n=1 Tax=Roseomonas sp. CECT 9278 TaxID=2845823 RepID=UPI001E62E696|nr:hypothetical protein [Roseomonas sp. CECT 9278]
MDRLILLAALVLAPLTAGVLVPMRAGAQTDLPAIAPGTPYDQARRMLLAERWQPLRDPEADRCLPTDTRCTGRPEMVACAGTGLGHCLFAWRRGPTAIEVITAGPDTVVTGLRRRR